MLCFVNYQGMLEWGVGISRKKHHRHDGNKGYEQGKILKFLHPSYSKYWSYSIVQIDFSLELL